jgi:hypothetical protein
LYVGEREEFSISTEKSHKKVSRSFEKRAFMDFLLKNMRKFRDNIVNFFPKKTEDLSRICR